MALPCQQFTTATLAAATAGFSPERLLGEGGFGEVFAALLDDGTAVAVKRMSAAAAAREAEEGTGDGERGFLAEVAVAAAVCHPNLLPVLGVAVDDPRKCLVYPLMRGGSLADRLHGAAARARLTAQQRCHIALGAARGLAQLHGLGVIHRDVKSSNILLDEAGEPRVADMGLCRVLAPEATHTRTRRMGTDGYIDPEYSETLELREASDVYSFGVVLLELIATQAAYTDGLTPPGLVGRFRLHLRAAKPLAAFADAALQWPPWALADLAAVAERCLKLPGTQRPPMADVLKLLERIVALLKEAPAAQPAPPPPRAPEPVISRAPPRPVATALPAKGAPGKPVKPAEPALPAVTPPPSATAAFASSLDARLAAAIGGTAAGFCLPSSGAVLSEIEGMFVVPEVGAEAVQALRAHAAAAEDSLRRAVGAQLAGTPFAAASPAAAASPDGQADPMSPQSPDSAREARGCAPTLEAMVAMLQDASLRAGPSSDGDDTPPGARLTGLHSLIASLRASAASAPAGVGSSAMKTVADIADLQLRAATAGGIDALVQTLGLQSDRPAALEWALWALAEVAHSARANCAKIGALGGLQAVVDAMTAHLEQAGLQEQGCRVLALVAADSSDLAAAVVEAGGVQAAARALRRAVDGTEDHVTAAAALGALAAVAAGAAAGATAAREAGVRELCATAVTMWPDKKRVVAAGKRVGQHLGSDGRGA